VIAPKIANAFQAVGPEASQNLFGGIQSGSNTITTEMSNFKQQQAAAQAQHRQHRQHNRRGKYRQVNIIFICLFRTTCKYFFSGNASTAGSPAVTTGTPAVTPPTVTTPAVTTPAVTTPAVTGYQAFTNLPDLINYDSQFPNPTQAQQNDFGFQMNRILGIN